MIRRLAMVTVIACGLVAAGAVAAMAPTGSSPAATPAAAVPGVSTTLLSNGSGATTPNPRAGWDSFGRGAGFGPFGGFGRGFGLGRGGLTVTGVSGNTISATARGGQAITVTVSATTAYTEAGASASLSDVQKGSIIAVQGTRTGTNTIQATAVTIVLPREIGVVTNVNGSTITMTGFDGATHTVNVTGSTRYLKAGASASLSDVATGTAIVAEGTLQSDGSLTAVRITIQLPQLAGQVTAVNGSSISLSGRFGTTYTVNTTSSTTYVTPNGAATTASAIKTGTVIVAEGTLSADGKTLTAQRIVVLPAAANRFGPRGFGGGRHGGFGGFGGGNGGVFGFGPAQGATTPSTTGTASI